MPRLNVLLFGPLGTGKLEFGYLGEEVTNEDRLAALKGGVEARGPLCPVFGREVLRALALYTPDYSVVYYQ